MKFSGNKKFLYVFLPIIAVVAMVISIVGIVLANEKSTPLYEVIGEKAESSSETSGDDVVEEETYNISGCSFSGSGTLLHVKAGASYVVENCTFSGASTNYAIIVFGWLGGDTVLTLKNCTIENCKAGAISVHGNILLDSTTIKDCTTENASVKNGGAIYVDADSDVTMSGDSVIQNCSSEGNGGAIYVRWCGSVTMNDNATIKECTSSDQGGAIYLGGAYSNSNGQCDLTMNGNSKIELCTATNQGGGVYQYGSFSNKGYTRLYENAQISQCSGSNGGGIYCHDMSPLEMYDSSSISNNTASTSGGGITTHTTVNLYGSASIIGNTATNGNGGGLYFSYNATGSGITFGQGSLTWNGSISGNKACSRGGGIYISGSSVTQNGGTISGNMLSNTSTSERLGAGVYYSCATFDVSYTMDNNASITGNNVSGFEASMGGGVYMSDEYYTFRFVMYGSSSITNNKALSQGGGIYCGGELYTTGDTSISSNEAGYAGGGVYMPAYGRLDFSGDVTSNKATLYGGGIFSESTSAKDSWIYASTISDNSATYGGGMYVNSGGHVTVSGTNITKNTATWGGGLYTASTSSVYVSTRLDIKENTATERGGGMELCGAISNPMGSMEVFDNTAVIGGGIFWNSGSYSTELNRLLVHGNTSSSDGAGVYLYVGSASNIDVYENTGFGVFVAATNSTISNSLIHENTRSGVYVNATTTISNTEIYSNTAYDGAGIFHAEGSLTIDGNSKIYNNTATGNGGGIWSNGGTTLTLNFATDTYESDGETLHTYGIFGNTAANHGGGINNYGSTITVTNAGIYGNSASNGGGISISIGSIVYNAGKIYKNTATNNGGGLYVGSAGSVSLSATIASNTADLSGGGVYMFGTSSKLIITGETHIQDNTASYSGGGIEKYGAIESSATGNVLHVHGNESRYGGGIFWRFVSSTGTDKIKVYSNSHGEDGGDGAGVYLYSGSASGLDVYENTGFGVFIAGENSTLSDSLIHENTNSGVYVNSTTTITNTEIYSNTADMGAGILKASSGTLTISGNSKIYGNQSVGSGAGIWSNGGTINLNFDMTMYTSADDESLHTFGIFENTSGWHGGGLFLEGCALNIQAAAIYSNTASGDDMGYKGGGIYSQSNGSITAANAKIYKNTEGIYSSNCSISISDSEIYENSGRGINQHGSTLSISGKSKISGNSGGGLYLFGVEGTLNFDDETHVVEEETLHTYGIFSNSASYGGGIYCSGNGKLTITNAGIYGNKSTERGGGIAIYLGEVSFGVGKIYNNQAGYGGGVFIGGGKFNVTEDLDITGNSGGLDTYKAAGLHQTGGDITIADGKELNIVSNNGYGMVSTGGTITLPDTTGWFVNISRNTHAGLYVSSSISELYGMDISNNDGRGMIISGGERTISNMHISSNKGGGVFISGSANITFDGDLYSVVDIMNNESTISGGGINVSSSTLTLKGNTYVTGNSAGTSYFGGGIYAHNSTLELSSDTMYQPDVNNDPYPAACISHNSANQGGGVYAFNSTVTQNCFIFYNYLTGTTPYGAGVFVEGGTYTISAGAEIFGHNDISGSGAGVAVNHGTLNVYGSIHSNSTTSSGGGIFALGDSTYEGISGMSAIYIYEGAYIRGNTADNYGGGIYSSYSRIIQYSSSNIDLNTAGSLGGGICAIEGSTLSISGTIEDNEANYGAGVYLNSRTSLLVYAGKISSNEATSYGGGIYTDTTGTVMLDGLIEISSNKASNGGGIYVMSGTFVMKGVEVSENEATYGAGLFLNGSANTLTDSRVELNIASSDGGGIYMDGGSITSSELTIMSNTAQRDGGGVMIVNSSGECSFDSSCTFETNTAANCGGGFLASSSTVTIDSSFLQNYCTAASSEGGNIYVDNGTLTFTGDIQGAGSQTKAAKFGGGIYVSSTGTLLSNANISQCWADAGGGIFNLGTATVEGTISSCKATNGGGGIVNAKNLSLKATISSCTVTNSTVSKAIANAGTLSLYASANTGSLDICIGQISVSGITRRGSIKVLEALTNSYKLSFADADYDTMRITNVNGGSNCYSYYNASTTHAVVTYSRIGLIAVGPENESINFSTVVDGVSLNSLGTTNKLYLY